MRRGIITECGDNQMWTGLMMFSPNIMKKRVLLLCLLILTGALTALADDEASNVFYVRSATYGAHFAKCIPSTNYGTNGRTEIFLATPTTNALEITFDWYSRDIYLQHTAWGVSVMRFGPWAHGSAASSNELAIAFYLDGKLLKSYSTLDIAGSPTNVSRSVSHYTVFSKVSGYRWIRSNDYAFDVLGRDGKRISFDVRTARS